MAGLTAVQHIRLGGHLAAAAFGDLATITNDLSQRYAFIELLLSDPHFRTALSPDELRAAAAEIGKAATALLAVEKILESTSAHLRAVR